MAVPLQPAPPGISRRLSARQCRLACTFAMLKPHNGFHNQNHVEASFWTLHVW
eukprot:COSAG05_NODE_138_length_16837_cov_344.961286_12_plen_53_part_00